MDSSSLSLSWKIISLAILNARYCSGFITTPGAIARTASFPGSQKNMVPVDPFQSLDTSSILQAVEVFDGSTVDPVVVSGIFWSSLQNKLISFFIGNLLASVVFGLFTYFLSGQLSNLGQYISSQVFKEDAVNKNINEIGQTMKQKPQSPTIAPDFGKLLICLVIDILGTSSELIPLVGEITDLAYAPVAALALRTIFQGSNVVFALEFVEEILPFTDILPLATICWVVETYFGDSDVAKTLQIGVYGPTVNNNVIDTNIDGTNTIIDTQVINDITTENGRRLPGNKNDLRP